MKKKPPLTIGQVENYLIYRCPLEDSRRHPHRRHWDPRAYPFVVSIEVSDVIFYSIESTPWACYRQLAHMVHEDPDVLDTVTKLYYRS